MIFDWFLIVDLDFGDVKEGYTVDIFRSEDNLVFEIPGAELVFVDGSERNLISIDFRQLNVVHVGVDIL